jgi:hypothetical protein
VSPVRLLTGVVSCAAALVIARPAAAQQPVDGGRLELSAGVVWAGALGLGSAAATETSASGQPVTIFGTSTTLGALAAFEGRVGWRFARSFTAEADAAVGKHDLRIAVSNDIEGAPAATVTERVDQFTIGGALVWHAPFGSPRVRPFAAAGGGYLRALHENATLVETGHYYQFGGGADVLLMSRDPARLKSVGVRVDARALVRVKGVAFDDAAHTAPAVGASVFVRF